jgi:hypothetical protein
MIVTVLSGAMRTKALRLAPFLAPLGSLPVAARPLVAAPTQAGKVKFSISPPPAVALALRKVRRELRVLGAVCFPG